MKKKKPTKEKSEKLKEKRREIALKNLKAASLLNLATAYFVNEGKDYGENDNSAVEEFMYRPAIENGAGVHDPKTGKKFDLVYNSLFSSRQGGKRYSGNVSEYEIIKTGAAIMQQSLAAVKVSDIYALIGSDIKVGKEFQDRYVGDLLQSKNKKDKELGSEILGLYQEYVTTKKVSQALNKRAGSIKSGLENIVKSEEN